MHKYRDQKDFSESKTKNIINNAQGMDLQPLQIPLSKGDVDDREPVVHDVNKLS